MKRPPWERDRLVRLTRVTLVAGLLIVIVGVVAVVGGVFDPTRAERAQDWVDREYEAKLGHVKSLRAIGSSASSSRPSPKLLDRLGRPARPRVCVFVFICSGNPCRLRRLL